MDLLIEMLPGALAHFNGNRSNYEALNVPSCSNKIKLWSMSGERSYFFGSVGAPLGAPGRDSEGTFGCCGVAFQTFPNLKIGGGSWQISAVSFWPLLAPLWGRDYFEGRRNKR